MSCNDFNEDGKLDLKDVFIYYSYYLLDSAPPFLKPNPLPPGYPRVQDVQAKYDSLFPSNPTTIEYLPSDAEIRNQTKTLYTDYNEDGKLELKDVFIYYCYYLLDSAPPFLKPNPLPPGYPRVQDVQNKYDQLFPSSPTDVKVLPQHVCVTPTPTPTPTPTSCCVQDYLVYNVTQDTCHCTIKAAIDGAEAGDIIRLSAHMYEESVIIDTDTLSGLVLSGESTGGAGISKHTLSITGSGSCTIDSITFANNFAAPSIYIHTPEEKSYKRIVDCSFAGVNGHCGIHIDNTKLVDIENNVLFTDSVSGDIVITNTGPVDDTYSPTLITNNIFGGDNGENKQSIHAENATLILDTNTYRRYGGTDTLVDMISCDVVVENQFFVQYTMHSGGPPVTLMRMDGSRGIPNIHDNTFNLIESTQQDTYLALSAVNMPTYIDATHNYWIANHTADQILNNYIVKPVTTAIDIKPYYTNASRTIRSTT